MLNIIRDFPLEMIQCGAPLGNGKTGALLWGGGNCLNITFGCGDLWDHRGGMEWTEKQNFKSIRKALEQEDMGAIREIFYKTPDGPQRPTLMPLGRIVLTFPPDHQLSRFELELKSGLLRIFCKREDREHCILFTYDMSGEHSLFCSGLPEKTEIRLIPSYDLFRNKHYRELGICAANSLEEYGYAPPSRLETESLAAFIQEMPSDPSFGMLVKKTSDGFSSGFFRGLSRMDEVKALSLPEFCEIQEKTALRWEKYWSDIPSIEIPDPALEEIYLFGSYKYGIMTNPAGVTPGLQGPWIEDDRLPPWQGDYHFNINVQMCNSPGFKSGCFANLRMLFDLVLSWKERLRKNAEYFCGIPDGYLLPHAVDDRCRCMGSFWTGSIDHGCAAWLGMMMFDYYEYSGDTAFLKENAFDFMRGVMRVFQQMMERLPDGTLTLPVSISPEYRGSEVNAWGADSSFQLAAIHRLAQNLIRSASILNLPEDPFWQDVEKNLPLCSLENAKGKKEIALWKGLLQETSHRHHSHLAGLTPFAVIDPEDPAWSEIVENSIFRWTVLGMGQWAGWSMPWASQIRTRLGQADGAVLILHLWKSFFNNAGGGSTHDSVFPGFTVFDRRGDVMQMDGAMGAVSAVQDLFVYSRDGIHDFFRGVPHSWKHAGFRKMHLPGGFLADGIFEKGRTVSLKITSRRGGLLRFRTADCRTVSGFHTQCGQTLEFVFSADQNRFVQR